MITLKYRLVGNTSNPVLTKTFPHRLACDMWVKAQGNILVIEIQSEGRETFKQIFG